MGAFNFIWDLHQSDQIDKLEERIEKLEEQNQILYEWVQYFRQQIGNTNGTIQSDDSGRTQPLPTPDP